MAKYEGLTVTLGDQDFIVPALTLGQLKRLEIQLQVLSSIAGNALSIDQLEAAITIIHAALARNYPELLRDDLAEMVDLRNFKILVQAVMGASGIDEKK